MSDSIPRHYASDKLFSLSHTQSAYEELLDNPGYFIITDTHVLSPQSDVTPFLYQGLFWQSLVHLYYSLLIPEHSDYIRSLVTADSVLYMVNKLKQGNNKLSTVGEANFLKAISTHFSLQTQPDLVRLLLRTGNKRLVYHSSMDEVLSDREDGMGNNLYGKMLTHIRSELRVMVLLEDSYGAGTNYPNLNKQNLDEDFNKSLKHGEVYLPNTVHINDENTELVKLLPSSSEEFSHGGHVWPSVEHFYQSRKFKHLDRFLITQSVTDLRKIVYDDKLLKRLPRRSFGEEKISIMYAGLKMKLNAHPETKLRLLGTKNAYLLYSNQEEMFWGCGKTEGGGNYLGKILMLLRKEFRFEERKLDTNIYPSLKFPFRNNIQFPKEYFDCLLLKSLLTNSKQL